MKSHTRSEMTYSSGSALYSEVVLDYIQVSSVINQSQVFKDKAAIIVLILFANIKCI